jgi:PAS domain S-box-containing protein
MAALQKTGQWSGEMKAANKDGGAIDLQLTACMILGVDGGPTGMFASFHDITERKRAEEKMRFFALAVESSSDAIGMSTPDGKHYYQNTVFDDLFGTVGENPPATLYVDEQVGREVFRTIMGGNPWTGEVKMRGKAGGLLDVSLRAYAIKDATSRILGLVGVHTNITERKRAEEALRESEGKYKTLVENLPQKIFFKDRNSAYISCNENYAHDLEIASEEIAGRTDYDFYDRNLAEKYRADDQRIMAAGQVEELEERYVQHGKEVWVHTVKTPVRDKQGNVTGILGIFRDVTEFKQVQDQLRHAQKMEAIGNLAGGVAHDFNNLLMVINGYSQILLMDLPPDSPIRPQLEEIKKAGDRAAALTRQLLVISRKQVAQPEVLVLNGVVNGMEKMLRRLIGEDIELRTCLDPGLARVKADPGQIEQILLNLAGNARDAMPRGGKLTIETANAELDAEYARTHVGVAPGRYALLAVSDTGTGIAPEHQSRIFEPFFTTKEPGKGTGLGLAIVHGIVKQHGGAIWLYSEPGKGTTFKVYLPRVEEAAEAPPPAQVPPAALHGTETILLVEDEAAVRAVVREALAGQGYVVLEAFDGGQALQIAREHSGGIDLLITDMVMPRMGGSELAGKLGAARPGVKVLFMSGYADHAAVHNGTLSSGSNYLQKPFTLEALTRRVREILDAEKR